MNGLQERITPAIIVRLDEACHALTVAQNDLERLRIRDQARTVDAAAKILNRRDIQVQASILVQEAEWAIAQATPPKKPRPKPPEDAEIKGSTLRAIR